MFANPYMDFSMSLLLITNVQTYLNRYMDVYSQINTDCYTGIIVQKFELILIMSVKV